MTCFLCSTCLPCSYSYSQAPTLLCCWPGVLCLPRVHGLCAQHGGAGNVHMLATPADMACLLIYGHIGESEKFLTTNIYNFNLSCGFFRNVFIPLKILLVFGAFPFTQRTQSATARGHPYAFSLEKRGTIWWAKRKTND